MSQIKDNCSEYVYVQRVDGGYEIIETVFQDVARYGQVFSKETDGVHTIISLTINDKFPLGNTLVDRCEAVKERITGIVTDFSQLDVRLRKVADDMAKKRADERRIPVLVF